MRRKPTIRGLFTPEFVERARAEIRAKKAAVAAEETDLAQRLRAEAPHRPAYLRRSRLDALAIDRHGLPVAFERHAERGRLGTATVGPCDDPRTLWGLRRAILAEAARVERPQLYVDLDPSSPDFGRCRLVVQGVYDDTSCP